MYSLELTRYSYDIECLMVSVTAEFLHVKSINSKVTCIQLHTLLLFLSEILYDIIISIIMQFLVRRVLVS